MDFQYLLLQGCVFNAFLYKKKKKKLKTYNRKLAFYLVSVSLSPYVLFSQTILCLFFNDLQ